MAVIDKEPNVATIIIKEEKALKLLNSFEREKLETNPSYKTEVKIPTREATRKANTKGENNLVEDVHIPTEQHQDTQGIAEVEEREDKLVAVIKKPTGLAETTKTLERTSWSHFKSKNRLTSRKGKRTLKKTV